MPTDYETHAASVADLKSACKFVNAHLEDKYFLVGDSVTTADLFAAGPLVMAFQTVLDAKFRKSMPHFSQWFERIVGLPSFVRRNGYVILI